MSHILKVGFEVEGGWAGKPGVSPFDDGTLIADHSINGQSLRENALLPTHVGEAVSPAFPIEGLHSAEDPTPLWTWWLTTHWPNAEPQHRTNGTCGFHIHISMASLKDYCMLSSKSFLFSLRDRMMELGKEARLPQKHCFWNRMHGRNRFCSLWFDPARQMPLREKTGGVRYGWLNFSWSMHGTIEFRALPTFRDASVGVRFAKEYFQFVDYWLEQHKDEEIVREACLSS